MMRTLKFIWQHPIASRHKLRALARIADWQVRSRLQSEVVVPWIDEQKLVARRGMTGATGNIYAGLHEFADMAFVLHLLRPGDVFVDVGANIGSYTVLASGVCRARTLAFEPDPATAGYLRRNVAVNDLGDLVTVHEVALGPFAGEVAFSLGRDTVNQVVHSTAEPHRMVRQATLDSLVRDSGATMLKLDVEGYEACVLAGARDVLQTQTLLAIASETVVSEVGDALTAAGFLRMHYDPFSRRLSAEVPQVAGMNSLYVRNPDEVRKRVHAARQRCVYGVSF